MIDLIALWLGYVVLVLSGLLFIIFLCWFTYTMYDYWLKQLLCWDNIQTRKDVFYFIKHKTEIQDYIKKLENKE